MTTKFGDQGKGTGIVMAFDQSPATPPAAPTPGNGHVPVNPNKQTIFVEDTRDIGLPTIDPVDGMRRVHQTELDSIMKEIEFVQEKLDRVKHGREPGATEYVFEGDQRARLQTQIDQLKQTYGGQVEIGNREVEKAQRKEADRVTDMQADVNRDKALDERAVEIKFEKDAQERARNVLPSFRSPLGIR